MDSSGAGREWPRRVPISTPCVTRRCCPSWRAARALLPTGRAVAHAAVSGSRKQAASSLPDTADFASIETAFKQFERPFASFQSLLLVGVLVQRFHMTHLGGRNRWGCHPFGSYKIGGPVHVAQVSLDQFTRRRRSSRRCTGQLRSNSTGPGNHAISCWHEHRQQCQPRRWKVRPRSFRAGVLVTEYPGDAQSRRGRAARAGRLLRLSA